jgi:hypothetical protein
LCIKYARQYSIVKDHSAAVAALTKTLVGLGRVELPTSPLSGVRSSHLSYRPMGTIFWWSWSGSNRRPPECKSGALPAELQPRLWAENRGQTDLSTRRQTGALGQIRLSPVFGPRFSSEADWTQRPESTAFRSQAKQQNSKWRSETRLSALLRKARQRFMEWNGCQLLDPTQPLPYGRGSAGSLTPPTFSLRKEVIQPQVLLRLPCYDFTPIMSHTLGRCLPCGSACRLLVQPTFVM